MNHRVVGQFLLLAILANGQYYEGEIVQAEHRFAWCMMPNCTCKGYDRAISPILFGATIDD
jgi:hypothetical protein